MTDAHASTPEKFDIFAALGAEPVDLVRLDHILGETEDARIIALFLWGNDCYNCDQAKGAMRLALDKVRHLNMRWLHANVYEQFEMAHRFSLHGVPAFFFFYRGKKLGRITAYPGNDKFIETLETLVKNHVVS